MHLDFPQSKLNRTLRENLRNILSHIAFCYVKFLRAIRSRNKNYEKEGKIISLNIPVSPTQLTPSCFRRGEEGFNVDLENCLLDRARVAQQNFENFEVNIRIVR